MAKDKKISSFSAFLLGVDGMVGSAIFLLPGDDIFARLSFAKKYFFLL